MIDFGLLLMLTLFGVMIFYIGKLKGFYECCQIWKNATDELIIESVIASGGDINRLCGEQSCCREERCKNRN